MDRENIIRMAREAGFKVDWQHDHVAQIKAKRYEYFAALVAAAEREACVRIIQEYRIPVGNSPSGELAREWTYYALKEICENIRARSEK